MTSQRPLKAKVFVCECRPNSGGGGSSRGSRWVKRPKRPFGVPPSAPLFCQRALFQHPSTQTLITWKFLSSDLAFLIDSRGGRGCSLDRLSFVWSLVFGSVGYPENKSQFTRFGPPRKLWGSLTGVLEETRYPATHDPRGRHRRRTIDGGSAG